MLRLSFRRGARLKERYNSFCDNRLIEVLAREVSRTSRERWHAGCGVSLILLLTGGLGNTILRNHDVAHLSALSGKPLYRFFRGGRVQTRTDFHHAEVPAGCG